MRYAVRRERLAAGGALPSPWGPIWAHEHNFRLSDVPQGDKAIITLRDPVSRFLSGFCSRQRKGAPRHMGEWTEAERMAFSWFSTPQELADALAEPPGEARVRAEFAMRSISHLKRRMTLWTGTPAYLLRHLDKILFFARQETLDDDWKRLRELLELPSGVILPRDDVVAHRTLYSCDVALSQRGVEALRVWYTQDYRVLEIAEHVRLGLAPPRVSLGARLRSLLGEGCAASKELLAERPALPWARGEEHSEAA